MKVLFIASWYATKENPIRGSFFKEQFEALNENKIHGVVLALDLRSIRKFRKWGINIKIEKGITVYTLSLPIGPLDIRIHDFLLRIFSNYVYKKIRKIHGKPDILHAHAVEGAGIIAYYLKKKYNIKMIITEHSSGLYDIMQGDIRYKIYKKVYNFADRIISVSPNFIREINRIRNNNGNGINYIPNIIDFEKFNISKSIKDRVFTFISIGNLVNVKGFDLVIKSFYILNEKYKDTQLIIIGDGSEKSRLKKLVIDNGLEDKVVFSGIVTREKIPSIINRAHCLVMGSRKETFGVVFVEALACGLPIIATKCDGPLSIVNIDNGLLVSIDSIQEMHNSMLFIYKNIDKYDRQSIRKSAKDKYSKVKMCRKILEIYNQVNN